MTQATRDALLGDIRKLSETLWERRCTEPTVLAWLSNFTGAALGDEADEQLQALYLLSVINYFGLVEIRELLKSLYRDLVRYPLAREVREELPQDAEHSVINQNVDDRLKRVRFLGVGNPAESGTHLLYYLRQESGLPKSAFASSEMLFTGGASAGATEFKPQNLERVILVDDVCGTGTQAIDYSRRLIDDMKLVNERRVDAGEPAVRADYYALFGSVDGLDHIRKYDWFDHVEAVIVIDTSCKVFHQDSAAFKNPPDGVTIDLARTVAAFYGSQLVPHHPLGYGDSQLLLALHHNVPDNTLPIIWWEGPHWRPAFKRLAKF
jgi:hypothetical protein